MNLGYLKYASVGLNFFLKKTRLPAGRIMGLTIETTNVCNLRCIYCPQSDQENHFINGKGFMELDTFKALIDNILEDFKPRFVSLHRDGEPLVNKKLERYIEYTASRGMKTGTSSNCTLIPQSRAKDLLEAGLAFIKTDFCADRELYERLRAGGEWGKTYEGMINILSESKRRGSEFHMTITDISTHNVPGEEAEANMEKLSSLFSDFRDRITVMKVYFHNALDESVERFSSGGNRGRRQYTLCHHPWVHIVVDFKGSVVPCCRDLRSEYVCGSLLEEKMRDIWNNERFVELREALVKERPFDINICAKCDLPRVGSYAGTTFWSKVSNALFSKHWKR